MITLSATGGHSRVCSMLAPNRQTYGSHADWTELLKTILYVRMDGMAPVCKEMRQTEIKNQALDSTLRSHVMRSAPELV